MTIITTKQAKQRGMIPIILPMHRTDPHLFQVYKDMSKDRSTEWAMVNAGRNRLEVWRRPSPTLLGWKDGKGGHALPRFNDQVTESGAAQ